MSFRKFLKFIFRAFGVFFLLILIYFLGAITFSYFPVNSDFQECEKDAIEIYIKTNGVHTDLVLPIKNELKNWRTLVNPSSTKSGDTSIKYAAFGWGDKGFYLETPNWSDLKFSTAFKAMFFLSSTAMHVTFYDWVRESKSCKKVCINHECYQKLETYIENSFKKENGNSILIKGHSYGENDLFYEANGTYNLFFTCNTWANKGLKTAGLKACRWTPFDKGIFYQYSK